jgi:hypothetical protein
MADLEDRGNARPTWLWILGVIFLAGFAWFILSFIYNPQIENEKSLAGSSIYSKYKYLNTNDSINEVTEFIEYANASNNPDDGKKFLERGLIKLQSALSFIADRVDSTNPNLGKDIDTLDRAVAKVDTSSAQCMIKIKPAFTAAVNAMESIQVLNYPDLGEEILRLKKTENSIKSRHSFNAQLQNIRKFFNYAAGTIKQMKVSYNYRLTSNRY